MGRVFTAQQIADLHIKRKIMSLALVIFVTIYYFISKTVFLEAIIVLTVIFVLSDLLYLYSKGKNEYAQLFYKIYPKKKIEEKQVISDASIFLIGACVLALVFSKEVTIISLIAFIFSDMTEHTIGILFHRWSLFWNTRKTWPAFLAGIIVSWIAIIIASQLIGLHISLWIVTVASLLSGIAGTVNSGDNVLIPYSIAIVLFFA